MLIIVLAACNGPAQTEGQSPTPPGTGTTPELSAPPDTGPDLVLTVMPAVAMTTTILIDPPDTGDEQPLQAQLVDIPGVYLVPASSSRQALADYLHTTVEQLLRVNPGLTEPVATGTLVVIPTQYHVSQPSSIDAVAAELGLSKDVLLAANPKFLDIDALAPGDVLMVPPTPEQEE